ncbi:DUF2247 family protein [Gilliamella sp. B3464]|uniref:DUF2247 family protein n=1 Tax=unclassified Gilliamella TaxID=2685620 RepID=UPI00226AA09F|nr:MULTISPECIES: DUF2247 family protein [unclassified Gilliamella]MCX8713149.1 DUF2247 family protein [Gilliamella sp. B3468]MCX8750996.1 DUF2247 family protein [Gilliamella sp. B3464]
MINKIFNEFEKLRIVDWGVVYLGYKGLPIGTLSPNSVSDYACEQLAILEPNDASFILVSELSFCTEINDEVIDILSKLCEFNNVNLTLSKRKWVVFSIKELLNNLPKDSLYGPLELNNFWNEWGEPNSGPNIIQGVNNVMTPNEFYSDKNYLKIISDHNLWIKKELNELGI